MGLSILWTSGGSKMIILKSIVVLIVMWALLAALKMWLDYYLSSDMGEPEHEGREDYCPLCGIKGKGMCYTCKNELDGVLQ